MVSDNNLVDLFFAKYLLCIRFALLSNIYNSHVKICNIKSIFYNFPVILFGKKRLKDYVNSKANKSFIFLRGDIINCYCYLKELDSFTLIKDTMRETCIPKLVDTWHHILVRNFSVYYFFEILL